MNNKIKQIVKHPLLYILILGLVIRLYYLVKTYSQTAWWDECVYMIMASTWSGGPEYAFTAARPILFSFIIYLFNFVTTSILVPRLIVLFFSMAAVLGMYYLGKSSTGQTRIGLLAALLTSVFYLHIFYSQRILMDTISFTFFIWAAYFFVEYFKENKPKLLYVATVITAVGFLFRITTAFILGVVFIYLLLMEGFKMFKRKELWIAIVLFGLVIAPYIVWGFIQFDGFVLTKAFETNAPSTGSFLGNGLQLFIQYTARGYMLIPNTLGLLWLIFLVIGLISFYKLFVCFDLRKKDKNIRQMLFVLLLFIIPLAANCFLLNHVEDRYIFNVFPAIILLICIANFKIMDYIEDHEGRGMAVFMFIASLILLLMSQFMVIGPIIGASIGSYGPVKEAGLWMKTTSSPGDVIVTSSYPQIQYYSQRLAQPIPPTKGEYETMDRTNHKYFIVSVFEKSPEWSYSYPTEKNLTIANMYLDNDKNPLLIVYNLKGEPME